MGHHHRMTYYVFATENVAVAAESQIVDNVRRWLGENVPAALSSDGEMLRGRNAATGELVDVYTARWAIPRQTASGVWVFEKPTADRTAPIPVEVFTAGITAAEADYDPAWFPPPPALR